MNSSADISGMRISPKVYEEYFEGLISCYIRIIDMQLAAGTFHIFSSLSRAWRKRLGRYIERLELATKGRSRAKTSLCSQHRSQSNFHHQSSILTLIFKYYLPIQKQTKS